MIGLLFVSCKNTSETKVVDQAMPKVAKIVKATDVNGKEYTSAYICPMYCVGSGSDKPGDKCPACNMDLVPNPKNVNHEGHNHEGHNH